MRQSRGPTHLQKREGSALQFIAASDGINNQHQT